MKFYDVRGRAWVVRQQALGRLEQLRLCGGASGTLCGVQVKCTVFNTANGAGYICSVCSSHKQYPQDRLIFSQLIWFARMFGTSFRRTETRGSGRFLWERSVRNPGMRSILRRGICHESPGLTETFRLARRISR